MLEPLVRLRSRADRRLRLSRALYDGGVTLTWVLASMAVTALIIEVGWGMRAAALPFFAATLLIPIVAVIRALVSATGAVRSAKAVDVGAGLHDRVGTALALAGASGGLVERQREDAVGIAAGVSASKAVPLGAGAALRRPAVALFLLVLVMLVCWRFDLRPPGPSSEPTPLQRSGEDLLAALGDLETEAQARGNKRLESAVVDLRDRVRQIVDEEKKRREEQPDEPEPPPTPDLPPPPLPEELPAADDLYSVSELEAMHANLQMELTAAMDFDLDSVRLAAQEVVRKDTSMRQFQSEIDNQLLPPELDMFDRANNATSATDRMMQQGHNPLNFDKNSALAGNTGLQDALQEVNVNEFDTESLMADDKKHGYQQLFQQFLEEYTADRGEQLADWLAGKRDSGPRANVSAEESLPDKTDAMAESGFEDVTDDPYADAPQSGESSLDGRPTNEIPEGTEMKTLEEAGLQPDGMALGEGAAETTQGAQGAGKGDGAAPGDGGAQQLPSLPGERLEQILGQITDDQLPPERQKEVLEEVAQHKIHGGLANDFGDSQGNYFDEADRLLFEESDELPPLFRDYAHDYFQALLEL